MDNDTHSEILRLRGEVETLKRALTAAFRWLYDPTVATHANDPDTIPPDYDDRYKSDMYDIRAGLRVKGEG